MFFAAYHQKFLNMPKAYEDRICVHTVQYSLLIYNLLPTGRHISRICTKFSLATRDSL